MVTYQEASLKSVGGGGGGWFIVVTYQEPSPKSVVGGGGFIVVSTQNLVVSEMLVKITK